MNEKTFFNRCKELAKDRSDTPWTKDHLAGFFQNFRPDGQALEPLFQDLLGGSEVYNRLRQIYLATANGYQRGTTTDAYFIVRQPKTADRDTLIQYAIAQLTHWRTMAEQNQETELVDLLRPLPQIKVSTEEPPPIDPNDYDSLDTFIYDVESDWHLNLSPLCPHARWMREGFYYINCDYSLAQYVTWPWYRESSSIEDPFQPYFKMWLHGAKLRCQSQHDVTLFVTS